MGLGALFGVFFLLLVLNFPVALCLALSSLVTLLFVDLPWDIVFQRMVSSTQTFTLLAIPFFILAGEIMLKGQIAVKLVNLAALLVGRLPGGLGIVNVLSSMLFGGISGSAVADTAAIGSVMIPMMEKNGQSKDFAVNVTISSSLIGVIIPPSHNMIIMAIAAGGAVSVSSLFLAGILPGIFVGLFLIATTFIIAKKRGYQGQASSDQSFARALVDALPALLTVIIIIFGVLSGVFTATESAAVAVFYAIFISRFYYKSLSLSDALGAFKGALKTSCLVFFIIAAANSFAWLLSYFQAPAKIFALFSSMHFGPTEILFVVAAILICLGTFMDMAPLIIITTPIFLPVVESSGGNPIQFAMVSLISLSLGLITPPVGTVLYAGASIGKIKASQIVKTIYPFYFAILAVLILVICWEPLLLQGFFK